MMEDVFLFEIRYDFIYPTEQLYQFAEFLSIVISPFPVSFEESVHKEFLLLLHKHNYAFKGRGWRRYGHRGGGKIDFLLASIQRWL